MDLLPWMERWGMLPPKGGVLLCAVSGGRDSVCLLHYLAAIAPQRGFTVAAGHLNHQMRPEARRDEDFVRELCRTLGVAFYTEAAPVYETAARWGLGVEETGRRLRYEFLFRTADAIGADRIATAHHAQDQAETVLLNLLRGTGPEGLGGIPPVRGRIVRPLLQTGRAEIEDYLQENGLSHVEDSTNEDTHYARNRLRHGALPALCGVNSAAERNLARFCEKAAKADEYFARQADALLASARAADAKSLPGGAGYALRSGQPVWMSEPLRQTDPLILDMALHSLVEPVRDAEEKYIRLLADIVEKGSGAVQLTDAVRFCARDGVLWREEADKNTRRQGEKADGPKFEVSLPEGGDYPLPGGRKLHIRVVSACFEEKTQGVHKKDLKNQADYAKINSICPVLRLRCRQPGDRFRPAGRGIDRELRKWMNEAGIPPRERDTLPLLAAGRQVLWVCGEGFADGLAPGPDTGQLLQVELENFGGIES